VSRALAAALLNQPAITAIVGTCRALNELPAGTALPALAYTIVDINPSDYLGSADGYEAMRVQVNPLATTIAQVEQMHAAIHGALHGMAGVTLAAKRVIQVRRDIAGPDDKFTDDAGAVTWTSPRDYIVIYE